MWRYLVGIAAGVLLALGGVLWLRPGAMAVAPAGQAPQAAAAASDAGDALPEPPAASEKTREERRFSRYDHDKDGKVAREEWLAARRKAFARLDLDHDGRLDFNEWAAKTEKRFVDADADRSGTLTAAEFAATRIARKTHAPTRCPPAEARNQDDG